MRENYKRLGDYIQAVNIRNKDLQVKKLLGVSIQKILMPSIANTVGTNMKTYKTIKRNQFAYGPVTSRNGNKISIALLQEFEEAIISQAYTVFEIIDVEKLNPEYLMMWFRRPEFDRYARYKSHGSARETFDWDEMCEVELPIPSIEKQNAIVKEYNTVVNRIKLNEQLNQKLEETAQAIYKHWFVDFNFPYDFAHGKPNEENSSLSGAEGYKSSGGKMVWNEVLGKEIPEGWRDGVLRDIAQYSANRVELYKLTKLTYVSTENMLQDKKGITVANSLPNTKNVTKFNKGDILISNIRPYFKKIWLAEFEGGCSNDILCLNVIEMIPSIFVYSILEQDIFFDYVMKGAKGTKMPRGDKEWIMNYKVNIPHDSILAQFDNYIKHIYSLVSNRKKENISLRALSELLLSKMINYDLQNHD